MWAAGDIAEWWDKQHEDAKKELDRFVENNPNLFGVLLATATATAMEVGKGTVDMLRFGEGAAEGGAGGFGKDAIRLVGLMGPLGKAAASPVPKLRSSQAIRQVTALMAVAPQPGAIRRNAGPGPPAGCRRMKGVFHAQAGVVGRMGVVALRTAAFPPQGDAAGAHE